MTPGGAERFLSLHRGPGVLVLPNAWDVVTARLFEDIGFDAVATTSGGVAASRGFPDGEHISIDDVLDVVQRIASAVAIPVTADMEAGFGLDPSVLARRVAGTYSALFDGAVRVPRLTEGPVAPVSPTSPASPR